MVNMGTPAQAISFAWDDFGFDYLVDPEVTERICRNICVLLQVQMMDTEATRDVTVRFRDVEELVRGFG